MATLQAKSLDVGDVISGRIHIVMDDGVGGEAGPGDAFVIPPGHDAWIVGPEPCVFLDFSAMEGYAVAADAT